MKNKPKISFLIPRLGINDRGAEVVVYELAKRLKNHFEVAIYVRRSKSKSRLLSDLKEKGISIIYVNSIATIDRLPQAIYAIKYLKKYLDKLHLNPDEIEMLSFCLSVLPRLLLERNDILFPANGVWGALSCRLVRLIKGTPFVYTAHGGIEPAIAMQKPDIYFAINRKIEKWLKKYFPKLKTVFLPNGVDLKKFNPKGNKVRINLEKPIYLVVAALIPVKRLELTIKAVAKLKKGSLMIVGDGPLRKNILEVAKKELGYKRFILKDTAYYDIPTYYRTADVFTLAAKGEPSSLVCMEALATNLPVVANDEELLEFLVGKAGILVNVEDITKYSEKLSKASRQNFGRLPLKHVRKFSWDIISRRYSQEIANIIRS